MANLDKVSSRNEKPIREFFGSLEGLEGVLIPTVTYACWLHDGVWKVVKARLRFNIKSAQFTPRRFCTPHFIAESFLLGEVGKSADEFIEDIVRGFLTAPHGQIKFPATAEEGFSAQHLPFHPEGLEQQNKISVLQIRGENCVPLNYTPLDWELKSAEKPYDNFSELCLDFGLGAPLDTACLFEAVLNNVVSFDFSTRVEGTKIALAVLAAPDLDTSKASIGYRLYDKGEVVDRQLIAGERIAWSSTENAQRGVAEISVPPAAVLHCYAGYSGVTYQHRWFDDPTIAQNPRRAAYERFDQGLATLREMCTPKEPKFARDLEAAISYLLWMLGFGVLHMGDTKRLQDGPDIIATTPNEHYLVVECTTGQVKGESKLERLVARAASVGLALEKSNNRHLKVLPVMVTSMMRKEVTAGTLAAREHGVLVLAREDVVGLFDRTLVMPKPDELFAEAERSLSSTSAQVRN